MRYGKLVGCLALFGSLIVAQQALADDASYCEALSQSYRRMIGGGQVDAIPADAMAKCKAGDYKTGIPILEKVLKDAKVTLPPRS
jgi:hypothetical protein